MTHRRRTTRGERDQRQGATHELAPSKRRSSAQVRDDSGEISAVTRPSIDALHPAGDAGSQSLRRESGAIHEWYSPSVRALTTDMTKGDLRPYFLWDEDVSIDELHQILADPDGPRRDQLLGKMLREARDIDVWHFVRPVEVARVLHRLRRRLGRRYAFWNFLIEGWRSRDLLGA